MTADDEQKRGVRGDPGRPPRRGASRSSGAEFAGVGLQLGFTFALFALAGYWLDKRLGTTPWLTIAFVFVGAAAGFYSVYRRVIGGGGKRGGTSGRAP